jgi:DnaK suppressor protein
MNSKELKQYEKILVNKRNEIIESQRKAALESEDTNDTKGDFVDQSEKSVHTMINIRIQETEYKLLKAIESALLRIENGTYGICQECGKPIAAARLRSVPWTRLCVKCKEMQYKQ